ncbi:WbqC-like protein family protein [Pseudoalteromonas sp. P1-13-1a]|uniref:WbqC family protein n=1 Tax=Pseudoalteromonas sp. P1-13-1a TaxID=1723756 RepID=UPI0006D665AF|nr:WbqC family protein [Pseudoalteromonas sp. P1-13-1a]KPZ52377.1 WbqC-like protein family protein [Pseudoalteromonas sp. P1-13-1a]
MSFAVMQPYLFPYLGYYQLVNAVDMFVFYDDVTFIKGGYINRNNILSNGKAQRFTIPVPGMSSNKLINELSFDKNIKKILKTIEQSYKKAPYFEHVFPLIESVLNDENRRVEHICAKSISVVFEYLGINKNFYFSSELNYNRDLSAADKLIAMADVLNSNDYINSPGGKSLYSNKYFSALGVNLTFIEMQKVSYQQGEYNYVGNLSMIDVLMWNNKEQILELLTKYRLV